MLNYKKDKNDQVFDTYKITKLKTLQPLHVSLGTYYLDIETTGLKPESNKIITIQYQKINPHTGEAMGDVVILKEWEQDESTIIRRLIRGTMITSTHQFDCVLIGNNLLFEHKFLHYKTKEHNLPEINIMMNRPMIDMHPILVLMNNGKFKDSGLDKMTGKKQSGRQVGEWYEAKEYDTIIEYIKNETDEFVKFFKYLCQEMPILHKEFVDTLVEK